MSAITIVQGGQFGSEAKGAIAAYLVNRNKIDIAVRTGATNAGHTCYYEVSGVLPSHSIVEVKLQQLPVGFVRPDTQLVLGAGSLIDPDILDREVALLSKLTGTDIRKRLFIDYRAGLHVAAHQARSKASNRHHAIGATGKGCSEALIDRIRNRGQDNALLFGGSPYAQSYEVIDTEQYLNAAYDTGAKILLEGTQGQLLDLYLGPYPYTTHKQTGPAQWMLEAGLSPSLPTEICMVMRTYPIRVAGNSGPLSMETSWPHLARTLNNRRTRLGLDPIVQESALLDFETAVRRAVTDYKVPADSDGLDQHRWDVNYRRTYQEALSELNKAALSTLPESTVTELKKLFEMTTVTRKLRRIARLSQSDMVAASRQVRPAYVALTFMNYWYPEFWYDKPYVGSTPMDAMSEMRASIDWVSSCCGAPVDFTTFGPRDEHVVDLKEEGWRS